MGDYQKLQVWQLAHRLACGCQLATRSMPKGYAELGDQLRRASLSIPTNLAEGSSRQRDADFCRFVTIAVGSAAETESLLLFARDSGGLSPDSCAQLLADVGSVRRMLFKLRSALQGKDEAAPPQEAPPSGFEPSSHRPGDPAT